MIALARIWQEMSREKSLGNLTQKKERYHHQSMVPTHVLDFYIETTAKRKKKIIRSSLGELLENRNKLAFYRRHRK